MPLWMGTYVDDLIEAEQVLKIKQKGREKQDRRHRSKGKSNESKKRRRQLADRISWWINDSAWIP